MPEKLCDVVERSIKPALAMLPAGMRSREAVVMLLAIGLQESLFKYRRQIGSGIARGWLQFEKMGGVAGVIKHRSSKSIAAEFCGERGIKQASNEAAFIDAVYNALEHDDVLAMGFGRLLLWTDPKPLPALNDVDGAWQLYLRTWRPGAYTRGTPEYRAALRKKWGGYYAQAMQEVSKCNA